MNVRTPILTAAFAAAAILCSITARAQHVVAVSGDTLTLSAGADDCVHEGMTGRICSPEPVGGQIVENCTARFVITSVTDEHSVARITKGDSAVKRGALANFDNKITRGKCKRKPPPDPAEAFLRLADRAFRDGDYPGALERYQNFLKTYPQHEKADYAAERAEQCRAKIAIVAPPPAPQPPAAPPPPPPPVIPPEVLQADKLAATAEHLFQSGQLAEARSAALASLHADSTNSRARATLRAALLKSVQSRFNSPTDVAPSDAGCYVADAGNNTLRLVKAESSTTIAGFAGDHGFTDGPAARARFNEPDGIAVTPDGTVYVADRYNSTIRRVAKDGAVTTFAGRSGMTGTTDGPATSARFNSPRRLVVAADGTLFVADSGNHAIRKITPAGIVETVAAAAADRMDPAGLAIDGAGNLLVADAWSHVIRKIDAAGHASILAGLPGAGGFADGAVAAARFSAPEGVAIDAEGAVYVADTGNHTIRKIENGMVATVAGQAGQADAVDGNGTIARLNRPSGIRFDAKGRLWIADTGNHAIRRLSDGFLETVAGLPGSPGSSDGAN